MTSDRSLATVLAEAASAAGRAPSVHNTQPWRWRVYDRWMELYADRERQLDVSDPDGRLLMISCGAALHHARVALAAEGWVAVVTRLPGAADPDRVARVELGDHIGVTPEAMRQFQATLTRHTDRRPVTDEPVPIEDVAAIRAAAEGERVHLHVLPAEQVSELAVAATRAETIEAADPVRRAEMTHWLRGPHPGTGLPDTVIPSHRPHTDVPVRDFGRPGTLPTGPDGDRFATYTVMFGDADTPAGWLRAGEALSAAWLTATERGVTVVPFSAVVEAAAPRAILRRLLAGLGHPYLVLRLGLVDPDHATPPHPPRLASAQTVEIVADQPGADR